MLVAVALTLVGLAAGVTATQRFGLRLGGVLTAPLLAVYTLRDLGTLPIFVVSAVLAYVVVGHVTRTTLVHGRPLFLVGVGAGMVASVGLFLLASLAGAALPLGAVELVGSVLPGIAAYNFHRQEGRTAVVDLGATALTVAGLLALGTGLVTLVAGTPFAALGPAVLLVASADVVVWTGAEAVASAATPTFALAPTLALVAVGLVASEGLRRRYGLRPAGIVALPVLALFARSDPALVPLYLLTAGAAYGATRVVARRTLVYGRVLLSAGIAVGVLVATVVAVPTTLVAGLLDATAADGMTVFVVGVLGGVGAYNLEVVPPAERPHTVAVAAALFAGLCWLAVALFRPTEGALLSEVGLPAVVATALVTVAGGAALLDLERAAFGVRLPDLSLDL
jgi:hypothetical protein